MYSQELSDELFKVHGIHQNINSQYRVEPSPAGYGSISAYTLMSGSEALLTGACDSLVEFKKKLDMLVN